MSAFVAVKYLKPVVDTTITKTNTAIVLIAVKNFSMISFKFFTSFSFGSFDLKFISSYIEIFFGIQLEIIIPIINIITIFFITFIKSPTFILNIFLYKVN